MKLMEINMSRKKGQIYSAEQKTKIVLELLKEEQTIAQIATKYKITSQSISKVEEAISRECFTCI